MKPYPEYKETDLAWLPKIPKHWNWVMLSQIATEQCSRNTERTENNVLSLSYGHVIRKKNLYSGLSPQDYGTYQIICSGNIIMRLTDLQNDHRSLRTGLVEERGIITSAYTCLRTDHNPAFLHYLLHSYDVKKVFYGLGGGVRQSIGFKDIRGLRFPLPSPEEQAQIVRYLDAMTAKINKLIRAKKKQIALLQEQKQAIINQAVTKGLDPHAEMKDSGIDWLGKIPKHWTTCKVKNLGQFRAGINLTAQEIMDTGLYPVYGGNGLRGYYNQYLYDGQYLLIGRQGALCGNIHIVSERFWPTEHAVAVKVNSKFNIGWTFYLLTTMNLNQYATASAQPGLAIEKIKSVETLCIDIDEQIAIVEYLNKQCADIDMLIAQFEKEIDFVTEYKNSLISSAVTGQIDLRNITVESIVPNDFFFRRT